MSSYSTTTGGIAKPGNPHRSDVLRHDRYARLFGVTVPADPVRM